MHKRKMVRVVLFLIVGSWAVTTLGQFTNFRKEEAMIVLKNAKDEIKKHYYDTKYHGIDLDAHFKKAEDRVREAQNTGQLFGIIAQSLVDFDDSHLYFLPPPRMNKYEYGVVFKAYGQDIFISTVKPESDAMAKGVKPGDRVLSINGFPTIREKLWVLQYLLYTLRPQPALHLVLQAPDQPERTVDVNAKVTTGKQIKDLTNSSDLNDYLRDQEEQDYLRRQRYEKLGDEIFIWKMPGFDIEEDTVDLMIDRARKCKALILDLRGNGGGYVVTLQRLVSSVFDREIKIAERQGRKELKPIVAKKRGVAYDGKIIVLTDSGSGSASEIFAKVIQLEKRGIVIGDRSAGAVMEARGYFHQFGDSTIIPYGFSVTDADVIMSDGKSLERVGVLPDKLLLPSAKDLAAGRDPVLAAAVVMLGGKLTAEEAGKLFPLEWRKS